jgi:hypothetical protein
LCGLLLRCAELQSSRRPALRLVRGPVTVALVALALLGGCNHDACARACNVGGGRLARSGWAGCVCGPAQADGGSP